MRHVQLRRPVTWEEVQAVEAALVLETLVVAEGGPALILAEV